MLERAFADSELVIGLVGAVGTELASVQELIEERLKTQRYEVTSIRVTSDVIPEIVNPEESGDGNEHGRISALMDAGNKARERSGDNSILALGISAVINGKRPKESGEKASHRARHAYVVRSLKHPEEVERLRQIYPQGFFLIGVHADEERRLRYLVEEKMIEREKAQALIDRDADEHLRHGQRVTDTFHLSDFFLQIDGNTDRLKKSTWRLLELLFGHPYVTPTVDEFSMFLAFSSSLRSADLSRQVGAVINVREQVVATGANDCPKARGGQYWSRPGSLPSDCEFPEDGRDFARGEDSNMVEQYRIIEEILKKAHEEGLDRTAVEAVLADSRIRDLTEFGRVVHAEMDALLSCARAGIPTAGGTLYSTTFPCHNCAKHIVAAGIDRVVFIEPYPKSKAIEFHADSIKYGLGQQDAGEDSDGRVRFEPFVGVGPRRFFDLFSMRLGSGNRLKRKDDTGKAIEWKPEKGVLRLQMLPASYLDLEQIACKMFNLVRQETEVKEETGHGN